jgi:hypothetical protein
MGAKSLKAIMVDDTGTPNAVFDVFQDEMNHLFNF